MVGLARASWYDVGRIQTVIPHSLNTSMELNVGTKLNLDSQTGMYRRDEEDRRR